MLDDIITLLFNQPDFIFVDNNARLHRACLKNSSLQNHDRFQRQGKWKLFVGQALIFLILIYFALFIKTYLYNMFIVIQCHWHFDFSNNFNYRHRKMHRVVYIKIFFCCQL